MKISIYNQTRRKLLADSAQVAATVQEKARGLLGRLQLPVGDGMFLTNTQRVHAQGMAFPIDLVFINRMGSVIKTATMYPGNGPVGVDDAQHVLELPAGTVRETGTIAGDKVIVL